MTEKNPPELPAKQTPEAERDIPAINLTREGRADLKKLLKEQEPPKK